MNESMVFKPQKYCFLSSLIFLMDHEYNVYTVQWYSSCLVVFLKIALTIAATLSLNLNSLVIKH